MSYFQYQFQIILPLPLLPPPPPLLLLPPPPLLLQLLLLHVLNTEMASTKIFCLSGLSCKWFFYFSFFCTLFPKGNDKLQMTCCLQNKRRGILAASNFSSPALIYYQKGWRKFSGNCSRFISSELWRCIYQADANDSVEYHSDYTK